MKTYLLFLCQFFIVAGSYGQKTDSIKYANGYLYFHEYGSVGEPVIVLTGGPGAGYQQLEEVARNLGKQHRAILLEQRGTGRSMPQPYDTTTINIRTAHDDLSRLMDHLKLKQAHLLGHSWGAMLAMSYASEYPGRVKSLILLDPGPFKLDPAINEIYMHNKESRLSPAEKEMRDAALKKFRSATASPADQEDYYKWELVPVLYDRTKIDSLAIIIHRGGRNPKMGSLMFQSLIKGGFDLTEKLSQFNKPVHIITGSQDPGAFVSYEIKMVVPEARLQWINKAGHFPMYEQPEQFYKALAESISTK